MISVAHPRGEDPSTDLARGPNLDVPTVKGERGLAHRLVMLSVAAGAYLLLSLALWWNVWTSHPSSTTICGCGDPSLFTWFLEWPAYAISHGLDPLFSTALFHPTGVNLLDNTAEVGIGVVLAPVTWLFGPVATLNVALTLSPVLSALAMFVLLRRWVAWAPAAFIGGLLYGFSPFIVNSLTDAHLMLGMSPIPPLVVGCLDEILVRQCRRPVVIGAVLGLLVALQFFIGTELLVLVVISGAIGLGLMVLVGIRRVDVLRQRARYATAAFMAATATALILLSYPLWFALSGPGHLVGPVWGPGPIPYFGDAGVKGYLLPAAPSAVATAVSRQFGGYQAPAFSDKYFGIGLVVVLVTGLIVWRRDRRLWLFAVLGFVSVLLSFGLSASHWTLWQVFVRFPLMENVIPARFVSITYLVGAMMLGLIVDLTHASVNRWQTSISRAGRSRHLAGAIAAALVAVVALVPIAWYYSGGVPLTAKPLVIPAWFRTAATHLDQRQVILAFPVPFEFLQSAMTWQAVDGMSYDMVGGGGPGAILERAGAEREGQIYLGDISVAGVAPTVTPQEITAVRNALDGWGVTMVVIPDPAHLPPYEQVHQLRATTLLLTAAIDQRPIHQGDAWVWYGVEHAGPPVLVSTATMSSCGAGPAAGSVASIKRATDCVLSAR